MNQKLIIADVHSTKETPNNPRHQLVITLEGGNPWFAYIWIDDVCYAITKGQRTVKIRKV